MQRAVELSWPPHDGAQRYRVQVRRPGRSKPDQVHVVDEPHLTITKHDEPTDGATWQVHSSVDGVSWELHVPPVPFPSEPDGPGSELTWEPSTATAYRVIIRDQVTDQAVHRQVTADSSARISWEALSLRHPHARRIQEWRDGQWLDLHPYRPLLPPPELALRPVPEEPGRTSVAHLVLVRLSGLPPAGRYGEQRPAQWWEQRLQLLGEWTIPALTAPESCDGWMLVCDSAIPDLELERLLDAHPQAIVASEVSESAARAAIRNGAHAGDALAVTHVLAGDRLRSDLGRYLRALAQDVLTNQDDRCLITFPLGVRLDRERGQAHLDRLTPAPAHTALLSGAACLGDVLGGSLPFVDPAYRRIDDHMIAAVLRAWPGPNELSSLHGQRLASVATPVVLASFGLDDAGSWSRSPMAAQPHA